MKHDNENRDLNLISFVWFNVWNDIEMQRPTAKAIKKLLTDFKRGEGVKTSLKKQRWVKDDIKVKVDRSRILKKYL